jgi:hypothetical protein
MWTGSQFTEVESGPSQWPFVRSLGSLRNCKVAARCIADVDSDIDRYIDGDIDSYIDGTTAASDLALLLASWSQ